MRQFVLGALALAGISAANLVQANDSTAAMAAGGLVLRQSRHIEMKSEDLFVSADEVRVRYVFRNRSPRPIRTIVAFPMPDLDLQAAYESDVAQVRDFRTTVDGRPIRMQAERRVFARGVDHTRTLARLDIPLHAGESGDDRIFRALARLPAAERQRLVALGLIEAGDGEVRPIWTYRETWYREQVFPAGRDVVVTHRYVPGTGGSAGSTLTYEEFRNSDGLRDYRRRYCVDQPFLAAVDRLRARTGDGREFINISEQWIGYVLTTGGNWRGPIGDFRLVIDKGRPQNLVSFCGQGVRQISPTRFEIRRRNWRPDRDLDILILRPDRPNE